MRSKVRRKAWAGEVAFRQDQAAPVYARACLAPAKASLRIPLIGKPVHTAVAHSTIGAALTAPAGLRLPPPTALMALLALCPLASGMKARAAEARIRRRSAGATPLTLLPQVAAALWLAAKTLCVRAPLRRILANLRDRLSAKAALAAAMLIRLPPLPETSAPTLRAQLAGLNSAWPIAAMISCSRSAVEAMTFDLPGERSKPKARRPATSRRVPRPTAARTWQGGPTAMPAKSSTTFQRRKDGMSRRTARMRRKTRTFAAVVAELHPGRMVPCTLKSAEAAPSTSM